MNKFTKKKLNLPLSLKNLESQTDLSLIKWTKTASSPTQLRDAHWLHSCYRAYTEHVQLTIMMRQIYENTTRCAAVKLIYTLLGSIKSQ